VKLWKDNRLDGAYELAEQEIADRFLASQFGNPDECPWPLDRALRAFITEHEPDGLSSVFENDDPGYDRVVHLVLDAGWAS
jgi:hypothetical protein